MAAALALIALSLAALLPGGDAQCSQFCTCVDSLQLADCSAREALDFRFTEIPVVPATTTELILTGNNISTLTSGSFSHLPALTTLQLDRNQLTTIPPDGFDSLPQLQSLDLDNNPLQEVGDGVFRHLSSLMELSIQNTPLASLTGEAFRGLDSLTTLHLDDNQLSNLSTNFLEHLLSLTEVSLTGNALYSLPDGFFNDAPLGTVQVALQGNPWSCDCRLEWIADFLDTNPTLLSSDEATVCLWPPSNLDLPISTPATADFVCGAPSITQQPQNDSILTDSPYTLTVDIDGAPFPTVTWNKDGEVLNYTERIFVSGYDASLQFTTVTNSDAGVYSVSLANDDGGVVSSPATLTVTEATCVDGQFTADHETDVDCGGEFCSPCPLGNSCQEDRDCAEELVCLYAHQLPSALHYITMDDAAAFTCANSSVPQTLLQSLLTAAVPDNSLVVNGNSTREEIESVLHTFMAETLDVPQSVLSAVSVASVDRVITPLYLLQAQVIDSCEETVSNLHKRIDDGMLKMTARITRGQGNACYNIRLNL